MCDQKARGVLTRTVDDRYEASSELPADRRRDTDVPARGINCTP